VRAVSCGVARCGAQALLIFDVQSGNKSQRYTGQVTLKGYDNMTGLGTPNGQPRRPHPAAGQRGARES
jgi:hypothetical protein